jgi:CMP/dCMP kinase
MAVLTISRLYGSGGDEIADQVCQILGYRHFNKRNIAKAAFEAGLSEQEIASYSDFSEVNYKYKTFLDRLLRRAAPPAKEHHQKEDVAVMLRTEEKLFNEASALTLVQQAIKEAYKVGNIVILGRAGQIILKDHPGVLHIRIEAPLEERVRRVESHLKAEKGDYETDFKIRHDARERIAERDSASADYVRLFYSVNWADPSLYHAVFNTGKIDLRKAAQIIVAMVECLFPEPADKPSRASLG